MKKITFGLLTAMLTSMGVSARQISPGEALDLASDFMNSSELRTSASGKTTLRAMKAPGVNGDVASPYYVFNRGENEGFVIISGDDRAPKILGYSDKGSFNGENLPPQLKAMMEKWTEQMNRLPESAAQHESWKKTPATRIAEDILMETANWGQGFPYNANCPIEEGANCVTGCVATAMAIVMKYNNWPETYDWASMPMNTEKDPLDYEVVNSALSGLMADAGEAVHMYYTPWESGANMNWVGHKLQQEFKYSPDCQFITSANFSKEEWTEMLDSNLKEGHPVVYSGSGSGSHSFVIDGRNSDGYHVNWGWDGLYNGYFYLDALTPNEYQDFSENTGMVINIVPDGSGVEYSDCFVDNGYFWSTAGFGDSMNISVETITKDEPFTVINNQLTLAPKFEGEIGLALVGSDNIIKQILTTTRCSSGEEIQGEQCKFLNIISTSEIESTDRIHLVSKRDSEKDYKLILGTIEAPSYLPISGNTPKVGKVKFNVQEGIKFVCYEQVWNDAFRIDVPVGSSEISLLRGLELIYWCSKNDVNINPIILKVEGPLLYGTIISAGQEIQYGIDGYGDYEFDVRIAELKDWNLNLEKAGSLSDYISEEEAINVGKLILSGKMNAFDFWYIRDNMPCLESLDLSNVSIEEVIGNDGNFVDKEEKYEANTIPGWALTNLHSSCLRELILPKNLKTIGSDALVNFKVKSISIPEGVEEIGLNVFYGNHYLNTIEVLNPEPIPIRDCIFVETKCPEDGVLYVPVGSAEKYKQAPVWQDFKTIIEGRMPEKVMVEEINIEVDTLYMGLYTHFFLDPQVLPETATDKTVTWFSCDRSIAGVETDSGRIVTTGIGETDIVGISNDLTRKWVSCHVKVVSAITESLCLNPESWEGIVGETFQITPEVYPAEAVENIVWSSSDESIATVDGKGNVSVLKEGSCIITAAAADGSGISAQCSVNSTSGVDEIQSNVANFDIYSLDGAIISKNSEQGALKSLAPGIYIMRQGDRMKKLVIR